MNDSEVRKKALNPNLSFIVRAPAGSGKTAILVQRYLKLLSLVDSPEEIIAITFTNKAATEMKNRVLSLLNWAKDGSIESIKSDFEKENFKLAHQALIQDKNKNWSLFQNPEILKIKTIDSYLNDLTFHLPFTSNEQTPSEQIGFYAKKAAENALNLSNPSFVDQAVLAAYQKLIANFGYKHNQLIESVANLLTKREQWLAIHFDSESQKKAIKKIATKQLMALGSHLNQHYKSFLPLLNLGYGIAKSIKNQEPFEIWHQKSQNLFNQLDVENLAIIQDALSRLIVKKDKNQFVFRIRLTAREGLPANLDINLCQSLGVDADTADKSRKQMEALLKGEFLQDIELLRLIRQVQILPTTTLDKKCMDALILLLKYANAELELLFKEHQVIDFSAIPLKVLDALGTEECPSDFLLSLDYQIKHLLIDEFQDVSHLQFELFKRLTMGWNESIHPVNKTNKKTLFLVGDPMQSIYRFRKAEVSHFNQVENNQKLGNLEINKLSLNSNFRSEPELVNLNNQIFATGEKNSLFDAISSEQSTASIKAKEGKQTNQRIYRCIYPADFHNRLSKEQKIKTKEILIEQTINHIRSLLNQGEKEIVILTRKRSALKELCSALNVAKINYSSTKVDRLIEQIEVIDLHSITRALFDFNDSIAWLSLLRSVYCSIDLDDLISIKNIANANETMAIYQALSANLSFLSKQSQLKITPLIGLINSELVKVNSLAKKVLSIHQAFKLDFYRPNQIKNCNQYLALLQKTSPANHHDFEMFNNSLREEYLKSNREEKLTIMTIHNAKGLEFDHVICFDLLNYAGNQNSNYLLSDTINSYPIVAINDYQETGVFEWLNQISKQKEKNERVRLNYVALTRAKKSNFIVLLNHPSSDSFFKTLIEKIDSEKIELKEIFDKVDCDKRKEKMIERFEFLAIKQTANSNQFNSNDSESYNLILNRRFITKMQSAVGKNQIESQKTPQYQWAGLTARSVGLVAHLFLEQIANEGLAAWDIERINGLDSEINRNYKKLNGLEITAIERDNVKKILENTINCKYAQFIFNSYQSAHNEFKLSIIENNQLKKIVIDRTFVDEDSVRWIIDYKTSFHQGGRLDQFLEEERQRYQLQLNQYAKALSKLESKPIKLGLYFPLHQKLISWDWSSNAILKTN